MADERDPKVSAHYRELGAEEPPRALDEAILAASRRAVDSRPAPLVAPTGRGRWYFPVAAAAVIMLAVAVTVQVERQKPDDEFLAQAPPPAPVQKEAQPQEERASSAQRGADQRGAAVGVERPKPAPKPISPPRAFTPDPAAPASAPPAVPQSNDALRDLAKSAEGLAAAAEPARPAEASPRARAQVQPRSDVAETRRMEAELQVKPDSSGNRGSVSASPAPRPAAAPPAAAISGAMLYVNPERWLEQIVELRREGKHDDADKLLAEFRRSYPDYKLSDEMRAKVEKK